MANSFKDLKSLQAYVHIAMREAIVEEVEPLLKEWIQEAVFENVYATYDPVSYTRRGDGEIIGDGGGLADKRFMIGTSLDDNIGAGVLERIVEHLAEPNKDFHLGRGGFSKAIQYESLFAGDPKTGMPPRPYMIYVLQKIETNKAQIYAGIFKSLAKRGIRTDGVIG